jgi:glycine oxidase
VIGGGIIGLSAAWECQRRGHDVVVCDPAPASGASQVAAGMLAPVSEAYFGEQELTRLLTAAAQSWPAFAHCLGVEYDESGTLQVGLTADDVAELRRLWEVQTVQRVTPQDLEPSLHPRARGVLVPGDHCVDPRLVLRALLKHVRVTPKPVDADITVIAAGCASAEFGLPVRPVKGVLLRLRGPQLLTHVIRGYADGIPVYLVPRRDGEVVVGASSSERSDEGAEAGAVRDLLRAATDLVPDLAEYTLAEVCVGLRPGTPDNGPIVGWVRPGVLAATGHYRHGVLAAPLTAQAIADAVDGKPLPEIWAPFSPGRFA